MNFLARKAKTGREKSGVDGEIPVERGKRIREKLKIKLSVSGPFSSIRRHEKFRLALS